MNNKSIVICGFPDSGKTTFLAALWHLVTARDLPIRLPFGSLLSGDATYLNAITARWLSAKQQDRTPIGPAQMVAMNLQGDDGQPVLLSFPDLSGEVYRRMWEERDCNKALAEILTGSTSVILFINADTIQAPNWVVDIVALSKKAGLNPPEGGPIAWSPRLSPTQVLLVDLLQMFRELPLDIGPRRLAIMLSVWDKAKDEGLAPDEFLKQKLPLLDQYLKNESDRWTWRVYGLSAQGGEYEVATDGAPILEEAETLRGLDNPSTRIKLVRNLETSHDLTEPLAWLTTQ